jgi:ABC-2 type transport system permease protein
MTNLIRIELLKLRGTLSLLLCLMAPALVAVVALLIALRQPDPGWRPLLVNGFGLWCYFVLPMTVAALAALLAQIEHGPRAWDHLFALPVSRAAMLMAKVIVLMLLIGAMSLGLAMLCFLLGIGAGLTGGMFPWGSAAGMASASWAASGLMAVIQLWMALRFRSFVAPIGLGLAGTFIVVASMGAREVALLPWAMPLGTIAMPHGSPLVALLTGAMGAVLAAPIMCWHLSRRDF